MRIVLDAMGSDNAPATEVKGAVDASLNTDTEILLVGDEAVLNPALDKFSKRGKISVVHASESIIMADTPMTAVRKKKDSSMLVGLRLVKAGQADGFISAGNTGALMLASRVVLGPIRGVARSAICQVMPTEKSPVVVLDLGANVDCTARHLTEFAEMGQVFSQLTLGVEKPRVGLLNIGEEQAKGNEVAKAVHQNLTEADHIHFVGNVEPKAVFQGKADVVVCDGFVGNVILKTGEAVASLLRTLLERELRSTFTSSVGAFLSQGAYRRLRFRTDSNEYAGAPLLGVNGIVIILHGSCTSHGVMKAIIGARSEVELGLNEHIRKRIDVLRQEGTESPAVESTR